MFITAATLRKVLGINADTVTLQATIKQLKEEIAELQSKRKIEELELKHLVKMKEEKLALELEKGLNAQQKSFNEKEMALQTKYHDKVMKVIEDNVAKSQELYTEILNRLPTVTVDVKKRS